MQSNIYSNIIFIDMGVIITVYTEKYSETLDVFRPSFD